MPAQAGIQCTLQSRWVLDHPLSRMMTTNLAKAVCDPHHRIEDAMRVKILAASLGAAVIALSAFSAPPVEAAPQKRYYSTSARTAPAGRPRARVRVAPRSFLDAGTEVLPGERKFLDYAFPPNYIPTGVVTNTGGKVGWDTSPLPGPFDLPSRRNPYGW
jgi:hypothetical protein